MRERGALRTAAASAIAAVAAVMTAAVITGCGSTPLPQAEQTPGPSVPGDPRTQLAARAAAAKDLRHVASYTLKTPDRPDRTVLVSLAKDGGWLVSVPGTALGGTVDVALAQTGGALYQCALPSPNRPESGCVRVAKLTKAIDPKIQHLFTDWLEVFMDRRAALAVTVAATLPGVQGTCFSVDTSAVSVTSPVEAGIFCYAADGTLTGARIGAGTLVLVGTPTPAPPSITLPAAVGAGQPLPNASPSPSPSPTGSSAAGNPSRSVTPTTPAR
ncbi:MAG: hypothetical protein HOV79_10020 [Hamadaea sp.]|nr:hypothetical protein [Hamadaea sp.]